MSENGLHRHAILTIVGVTALSLIYLSLRSSNTPPLSSLQRRNALRHNRRRTLQNNASHDNTEDHTARAIALLEENARTGTGYGEYHNSYMFEEGRVSRHELNTQLTPPNLRPLYNTLVERCPYLTQHQRDELREHINRQFLENFLKQSYPPGHAIGDDVERLREALNRISVPTEHLQEVVSRRDNSQAAEHDQEEPEAIEEAPPVQDQINALAGRQTNGDVDSDSSKDDEADPAGNQLMLDLLHQIASDKARREGYIHRGVECNECGVLPIQGIRYHCANCWDYDLCETCEAEQNHTKNHVFYKIRVPAPSKGSIKQVMPKWYPGKPDMFPSCLPKHVAVSLIGLTQIDRNELEALYQQFICLAAHQYPDDPCGFKYAIDRKAFDEYFQPTKHGRPSPSNLIFDRIFALHDSNNDGLIGFEEFVVAITSTNDKSRLTQLRRVFKGFDLDGDGYVNRRDFLLMLRSFYLINKEVTREAVAAQQDCGPYEEDIRETIQSSRPISVAFGGSSLPSHRSRGGQDKQINQDGDLMISNGTHGVLQNNIDPPGNRGMAISDSAMANRLRSHPYRTFRPDLSTDEPVVSTSMLNSVELVSIQHADDASEDDYRRADPVMQPYGWPPLVPPTKSDIINALGSYVPLEEITDFVDRSRVFYEMTCRLDREADSFVEWQQNRAVNERWRRRQFYLDEEEGWSGPPGYTEPDDSDDESRNDPTSKPLSKPSSRRQSLRSRSSSKVRFDDTAIDTDYETRSNASSKSTTLNERWGGYELGTQALDIGKDALYESVQQGMNRLLDSLFAKKEEQALDAKSTAKIRLKYAKEIDQYISRRQAKSKDFEEKLKAADMLRTEELLASNLEGFPASLQSSDVDSDGESDDDSMDSDSVSPTKTALNSDRGISGWFDGDDSEAFDPTLPQFRPDADSNPETVKPQVEPEKIQPTKQQLRFWHKHNLIDAQNLRRGGAGKLNFDEFRRRMVPALSTEGQILEEDRRKRKRSNRRLRNRQQERSWRSSTVAQSAPANPGSSNPNALAEIGTDPTAATATAGATNAGPNNNRQRMTLARLMNMDATAITTALISGHFSPEIIEATGNFEDDYDSDMGDPTEPSYLDNSNNNDNKKSTKENNKNDKGDREGAEGEREDEDDDDNSSISSHGSFDSLISNKSPLNEEMDVSRFGTWESTADLGPLAFVTEWLDIAGF